MISARLSLAASLLGASLLLSGCDLYFGDGQGDDLGYPGDDGSGSGWGSGSGIDGGMGSGSGGGTAGNVWARCEDGVIRTVGASDGFSDFPGHGAGTIAGHCSTGCQSAVAECSNGNCTAAFQTLCDAPSAVGAPTQIQGSSCSTANDTISYGESTTCGQSVGGGTCTCNGHTFDCAPSTPTAEVHASLVGKWKGTVYPPSFTQPYPVSLWIYPDGTYWAECGPGADPYCNAFYYGSDGPHPWRRIDVLATSSTLGSYANIGIFTDFNIGAISSLFVSSTTLSFTYNASWFNCGQPFNFQLTRQ